MWVNPRFEMIDHPRHYDEFMLSHTISGALSLVGRDTTLWRALSSSFLRVVQCHCLCSTQWQPISTSQSSPKQPLSQGQLCQVVLDRLPSADSLTGDIESVHSAVTEAPFDHSLIVCGTNNYLSKANWASKIRIAKHKEWLKNVLNKLWNSKLGRY